jgi:hypothetical protein
MDSSYLLKEIYRVEDSLLNKYKPTKLKILICLEMLLGNENKEILEPKIQEKVDEMMIMVNEDKREIRK